MGPSKYAIQALKSSFDFLNYYPSSSHKLLRQAIADVHNIDSTQIICGAGSDEIISFICQCFCAPNDQVCRYRCIVSYESKEFEDFASETEFRHVARVVTSLSLQDKRIVEYFRLIEEGRKGWNGGTGPIDPPIIEEKKDKYDNLESKDIKDIWRDELNEFEKEYKKL